MHKNRGWSLGNVSSSTSHLMNRYGLVWVKAFRPHRRRHKLHRLCLRSSAAFPSPRCHHERGEMDSAVGFLLFWISAHVFHFCCCRVVWKDQPWHIAGAAERMFSSYFNSLLLTVDILAYFQAVLPPPSAPCHWRLCVPKHLRSAVAVDTKPGLSISRWEKCLCGTWRTVRRPQEVEWR